ncbi:STAS domain-containing protein [Chryseobacterium potabilaquae]|uniref:Anti-sigma factor antagonist n=1 Tax=Chryseobacterium potabilaquae TaxID=2675057 RepID=A0A6N4X8Q2_9FLAO|nr:STAS domain-containing protein [Chryseobacterium potabilaquae]CAA7196608.1 Putative anti-sigma factor antagonist BtrV [Chryseobacterium potabilaquae]
MKNSISKIGQQTIVQINGCMDSLNAQEFAQSIQPLFKEDKPDVHIDCSGLQYINSNGLRVFMTLLKYISSMNGQLFLTQLRPEVKDIFDMTGFSALFDLLDDNRSYALFR